MKFSILFCLFVILCYSIDFSAGKRSKTRNSTSKNQSQIGNRVRKPILRPSSKPSSLEPVQESTTHKPRTHKIKFNKKPKKNNPPSNNRKDASNIFLDQEGEGHLKPLSTNDNKQTRPSAPVESINKVHVNNQQSSPNNHESGSNPDLENPSYKPSNPINTPSYPINNPISSSHNHSKRSVIDQVVSQSPVLPHPSPSNPSSLDDLFPEDSQKLYDRLKNGSPESNLILILFPSISESKGHSPLYSSGEENYPSD